MDRNTIIGLVLIAGILITFNVLNRPSEEEQAAWKAQQEQAIKTQDSLDRIAALDTTKNIAAIDSTHAIIAQPNPAVVDSSILAQVDTLFPALAAKDSVAYQTKYDSLFTLKTEAAEKAQLDAQNNSNFGIFAGSAILQNDSTDGEELTLQNDKIRINLSTQGGQITAAFVKGYESYQDYKVTYDGGPANQHQELQLFDKDSTTQQLVLTRADGNNYGKSFETSDLNFTVQNTTKTSVTLRALSSDPAKYIDFIYTLNAGSYEVDYRIDLVGLDQFLLQDKIFMKWKMKGLLTEKSPIQERRICGIFYKCQGDGRSYMGEVADEELKQTEGYFATNLEWVAFKHNFFSSMIYKRDGGFNPKNTVMKVKNETGSLKYANEYMAEFKLTESLSPNTQIPMNFYFGPNDFEELSKLNIEAEGIINLGPSIFRAVNKWLIIPIFNFLQSLGLGYGWIIILLTLIIKLLILPLTYRNYKSSAKMRVLRPEIQKINAKYPNREDAMKKQQETMALYRKSGASPMAGCIPMIIQMPILFAAFRFFPSSLDLRQKSFLWAEDLSAYDQVVSWSDHIPFLSDIYGNHISLLTILMCISTLLYTRMNSSQMNSAQPGMPNMQVIMYIFPVMMLFFFNSFASGLVLYYLCGNLMNMGLMYGVKNYMIDEDKIRAAMAERAKKPAKQSKFQQRLAEMAKQQQQKQQRR